VAALAGSREVGGGNREMGRGSWGSGSRMGSQRQPRPTEHDPCRGVPRYCRSDPKHKRLLQPRFRVPELRSSFCTSPSFLLSKEPVSRWCVEDSLRRGLIYLLYLDISAGSPGRLRRSFSGPLGSPSLHPQPCRIQGPKAEGRSTVNRQADDIHAHPPRRAGGRLYRLRLQTALQCMPETSRCHHSSFAPISRLQTLDVHWGKVL